MELSELTAYAEEKFHIREQRKWADFPGFSVLADPYSPDVPGRPGHPDSENAAEHFSCFACCKILNPKGMVIYGIFYRGVEPNLRIL